MLEKLYRIFSKAIPNDITRVLSLDFDDASFSDTQISPTLNTLSTSNVLTFSSLSFDQLTQWVGMPGYELNEVTVSEIDGEHTVCIGAHMGDELAGYMFFCASPVDAQRNSGGQRFTGIEMSFPENVRYLYKALVLPQFRGQHIAQQIIQHAVAMYREKNVQQLVTTTAWNNKFFLRTAYNSGFKMRGTAGEFILLGKHSYVVPKKIQLNTIEESFLELSRPGRSAG